MKKFKIILPVLLVAVLGLLWTHQLAQGPSAARIKVERDSSDVAGFTADDEAVSLAPYDPYFLRENNMILNPNSSAKYSIPTPKGFHHKISKREEFESRYLRKELFPVRNRTDDLRGN